MKISVLDSSSNCINVVSVPAYIVDSYGSIANYLSEHCGYNLSDIKWMASQDVTIKENMSDSDYTKDEGLRPNPLWVDNSLKRLKIESLLISKAPWIKVKPQFFIREEYMANDETLFGDNENHVLKIIFYDGFGVEETKDARQPLVILYPTEETATADKEMYDEILDYSGNFVFSPFEIAIRFGKLISYERLKEIIAML